MFCSIHANNNKFLMKEKKRKAPHKTNMSHMLSVVSAEIIIIDKKKMS